MTTLIWFLACILFIFIELGTMSLTTIWFAGGSGVAFILSLLHFSFMAQVIAFLAVSVILLAVTRPLAQKYLNSRVVKTNVESLIGQDAEITGKIESRKKGVAVVNGQEWTAEVESGEEMEEGETGTIINIIGVTLILKKKNKERRF